MEQSRKRKSSPDTAVSNSKKQKKQWRTPKKDQQYAPPTIEPGDAGIWATCAMGKEGKSTVDLRDLFEEYANKLYGPHVATSIIDTEHNTYDDKSNTNIDDEVETEDIESSIASELASLKAPAFSKSKPVPLFQAVKVDTQCVLFFKTRPPVEPVSFVQRICQDASEGVAMRSCRFVKRLTPMSRMGKATETGLAEVGEKVLGDGGMRRPGGQGRKVCSAFLINYGKVCRSKKGKKCTLFRGVGRIYASVRNRLRLLGLHLCEPFVLGCVILANGFSRTKFAIRPTVRNNNVMKRDGVIKHIATAVGELEEGWTVDLKNPDALILVEIYRNMLGMSVVDRGYEKLKRFNLAEIKSSYLEGQSANNKLSERTGIVGVKQTETEAPSWGYSEKDSWEKDEQNVERKAEK